MKNGCTNSDEKVIFILFHLLFAVKMNGKTLASRGGRRTGKRLPVEEEDKKEDNNQSQRNKKTLVGHEGR